MKIKEIALIVLSIVVTIAFIYGCYWAAKTVSYQLFYEDMVTHTIQELVKPESLK